MEAGSHRYEVDLSRLIACQRRLFIIYSGVWKHSYKKAAKSKRSVNLLKADVGWQF